MWRLRITPFFVYLKHLWCIFTYFGSYFLMGFRWCKNKNDRNGGMWQSGVLKSLQWRLSSIEGRLPLKGLLHQSSSPIEGCLLSKVVFHWRSSSIEGCLPSKVDFLPSSVPIGKPSRIEIALNMVITTIHQISSGTARKVSKSIDVNDFQFWMALHLSSEWLAWPVVGRCFSRSALDSRLATTLPDYYFHHSLFFSSTIFLHRDLFS